MQEETESYFINLLYLYICNMEYKIVKIGQGTHKKLKIRAAEEERNIEEVAHDPEVAQLMEEAQREHGTFTPEELRRQFTI